MFTKIDIKRFGSFQDYVWKDSVGANESFKHLNLIYGRNYSGKTTLSRIFRSLEEGRLPYKYENGAFSVTCDGNQFTERNLTTHNQFVRVYNRDFARENLSFLTNEADGSIRPFAVVGALNNALEEQIKALEDELGADDEHGLRRELATATATAKKAEVEARTARSSLDDKLRNEAVLIKGNRSYGKPTYTIDSIRKDISEVERDGLLALADEESANLTLLLKEETLPPIKEITPFQSNLASLAPLWTELLGRKITPTKPLQDLLDSAVLQAWVKSGIPLHKGKRDTCGFCGSPLPSSLWESLGAHFNEESTKLEEEIQIALRGLEQEAARIQNWFRLATDQFYSSIRADFESCRARFEISIQAHLDSFDSFRLALAARAANVFEPQPIPSLPDTQTAIDTAVAAIDSVIRQNNDKSQSLSSDQESARERLRRNAVLVFKTNIGYGELLRDCAERDASAKLTSEAVAPLQTQRGKLESDIATARAQQNDESAAALRINELLHKQFGHGGLHLVSGGAGGVAFSVMRGNDYAYNLSEGECSLIAFCYFLARLEDKDTKGRQPVVYIDDPISSLDSNHVFFLFSLIEEHITSSSAATGQPYAPRYSQVFISTHNLDFLKYLKCLSAPKDGRRLFLVERGKGHSRLVDMPKYMKAYQTEFVYLFHQIYLCQDEPKTDLDHDRFYSFGNNLRKFLEAYLYYKYPFHGEDNRQRLTRFFGSDTSAVAVTTRLSNELSHLEEIFDRGMRPVDVPEIPALAKFVVSKIREKDPEQCEALLKSIGVA